MDYGHETGYIRFLVLSLCPFSLIVIVIPKLLPDLVASG